MLKKIIKYKLKNYKVEIALPDESLPLKISKKISTAVVGGGIAGISAASNLAERGFKVDLYEKSSYLGGKLGAWNFESNGEVLNVEHGFHAFFKQYFNLLDFLKRIGAHKNLIPIDDYLILYQDLTRQSFKNMEKTPLLNIWAMRKTGIYQLSDMMKNKSSIKLLQLFLFDFKKTFSKFDSLPLSEFLKETQLPEKMKMIFTSFGRAFFAEPEQMSTAELMKSFHFYFLSNNLGLLYDVMNDDFSTSFLRPAEEYLKKYGVQIYIEKPVSSIEMEDNYFIINDKKYDYCILAADVKHLPKMVAASKDLDKYKKFKQQIMQLKSSARYAVWRIWTDQFVQQKLPFFIFTDRIKVLDSITLYHEMENESKEWSKKNNGGIYELHCYALPENLKDDSAIQEALLDDFFHYFPELKLMNIRHQYFQHKNDFTAFHANLHQNRPEIKTEVPNLYLAGDWVKMNNCTMLMEAAYTSGSLAANAIMEKENIQINRLFAVPNKGLLTGLTD